MDEKVILSPELLEQIIYGMENQSEIFCFDIERLSVIPRSQKETEDPEELRYLTLPRWTPADGYNIMERFVLSLNNPLYRDRLRTILHSGKGVFRNFKDLLKEKPEIEKLWFHYKNKELRSYIQDWLDSFENYRNMMTLGEAKENLEELVLSDFLFLENPTNHLQEVLKLDREVLSRFEDSLPSGLCDGKPMYTRMDGDSSFMAAESPRGELAGFMAYHPRDNRVYITNLFILPEYRGLRMAQEIYLKTEELLLERSFDEILVESVLAESVVNHFFLDKEFQPRLITYSKKLRPDY